MGGSGWWIVVYSHFHVNSNLGCFRLRLSLVVGELRLIIKDKKSHLKKEKYPWFIYGKYQFKTDKQIIDLQFTCKNFTNDEPNIVFKLNFKS